MKLFKKLCFFLFKTTKLILLLFIYYKGILYIKNIINYRSHNFDLIYFIFDDMPFIFMSSFLISTFHYLLL
jgi:hypothetical protein